MSIRKTAALLTVMTSIIAAGIGAGGVATASAATATLRIDRISDGYRLYCRATVTGKSAKYYQGGRVAIRLWGSDEWYDDLIAGPINANYDGLYFSTYEWWINCDSLDEDWDGRDEIYAGVRVYNRSGTQVESVESNYIYGHY